MSKPTVLRVFEVEAFLADEPVEACPVNMALPAPTRPLPMTTDPIPPELILGHPLGSNIQDILENFYLEPENSVGMEDENIGGPTAEAEGMRPQPKSLSSVQETGTASRTVTPRRRQSPTSMAGVVRASGSRTLHFAEASDSKVLHW